jgi:hypothetical protein
MNATAAASHDLARQLSASLARPRGGIEQGRGPLASAPGLVLPQARVDEVQVSEQHALTASRGRRLDQVEGALFALLFSGVALMTGSFALQYLL